MEIKFDSGKDYITKSDHKEQIMKYLSWKIKPFSPYHESYEINRILKIIPGEAENIMKELENENKTFPLIVQGSREIQYMLKADIQLQYLMDIKKSIKKPAFINSLYLYPPSNRRNDEWVVAIQNFVLGKDIKDQVPSYIDSEP